MTVSVIITTMKKKISKKKKEMTIEDLALTMQKGFKDAGGEDRTRPNFITRHDRELEQLQDRILQIETKLAKI